MVGDGRLRVVFDREGWSRELFQDLLRLTFNFITYRKGDYIMWLALGDSQQGVM